MMIGSGAIGWSLTPALILELAITAKPMRHCCQQIIGWVLAASLAAAAQVESSSGTVFHFIEGGRFIQGTDGGERVLQRAFPLSTTGQSYGNAEGPAHPTWLTRPFFIAETEVTVGQFRRFVDATGYQTSAERGATEMVGWEPTSDDKPLYQSHDFVRDGKFNWRDPGFAQADDHPVVGVSYSDAKAYCRWLSEQDAVQYRLPTEAEWEFVCRAGTATWFSFGDVAQGVVHRHANLGNVELERHRQHAAERQWLLDWDNAPDDGHVFTAPVGSYERNPWGIADMHGNVWEWCEDLWLDTVYQDFSRPRFDQPAGVAIDPVNLDRPQTPTNDFHTIRGGCWYNGDLFCRSANRTYWDAEDASCYLGFRLVREADPASSTVARDAYQAERAVIASIAAAGGKLFSSRGTDIEVRFEGDSVDPSAIDGLAKLPDLERLRIRCRDRDTGFTQELLDAIATLPQLRQLEFQSGAIARSLDLSVLVKLKSLQSLSFPRDGPLDDSQLAMLAGFRSLREFQCFGTGGGLTDRGIAMLGENQALESISVFEHDASGAYLNAFHGCRLLRLDSTARFNTDGAMTDVQTVHLRGFPELRSLSLEGQSGLTGITLDVIGGLKQLQDLNLQRCQGIEDAAFAPVGQLQRLVRLNVAETKAADQAALAIGLLPRLEWLHIGSEQDSVHAALTDRGVESLSQAFSISELHLASHGITDQGVQHLGRINRLRELRLSADKVTGAGFGPLAKLPELRDVSLRTSGLQDEAFEYLCRAKSVAKLRLADRGYPAPKNLTNNGMMKMAAATWLSELWLPRNGTGITEDKINELKQALPKTNVIPFTLSTD